MAMTSPCCNGTPISIKLTSTETLIYTMQKGITLDFQVY